MFVFWTLATLMTVVALAIVLVPMLRARATVSGPSSHAATLDVLRGQRREIDNDIAAGILPAEARDESLAELLERAGEDLPAEAGERAIAAPRPWLAAGATALAIPLLAFGLYGTLGKPSASDPKTLQVATLPSDDKEIVGMVENLARKVRERPDDARGWELLARSMSSLGRFNEAVEAYEHLAKLTPRDAQVLADWADALGMAQGRTLRGRPRELAEQALAIDARHPKALALAATAAMDAGESAAAIAYWQRLKAELPPDSADAAQVGTIIADLRQGAGGSTAQAPAPVTQAPPAPQAAAAVPKATAAVPKATAAAPKVAAAAPKVAAEPAPAASAISGSVALAPSLASKVKGSETLYVFARSEGGSRIPLAVVRTRADSLPFTFALDDSQAMSPGMNLSSALAVRVEARISVSGSAMPQPGDLVGTSPVIKPGTRGVQIVVDRVVP